eukprot:ctg_71.g13
MGIVYGVSGRRTLPRRSEWYTLSHIGLTHRFMQFHAPALASPYTVIGPVAVCTVCAPCVVRISSSSPHSWLLSLRWEAHETAGADGCWEAVWAA